MKKRKLSSLMFFIITAVFTLLFPACSGRGTTVSNELRYGFTTEPATLDPLNPEGTADGRSILFNVFEGLVKPDTSGRMQPCIAESWTIEHDGLVYNFKLREGVRFHDGSILNSADVQFSLQTAAANGYYGLDMIKETAVTGNNQIRITLKTPDTEFLPYLTVAIVKADNADREKNIIGTGPFFIESYATQRDLVLKKFDNYWQRFLPQPVDIPHLDKVIIVFFENSDAQMVALRGGSIDGASITGSMVSQLDRGRFDTFNSYSAAVHLLALNNAASPLDDLRVRTALNYGIDIQNIIDAAFFGLGAPSGSPIIPGLAAYYENYLDYPYDPDKARSLLAEAGFSSGEGRRLSLEITVPSNYTMHVDTAQVIATQLEKIDVNVNIKLVDWSTWRSDVYFGRQYQATIISLDSQIVSPKSFLSRYCSDSGSNFINFKSANFDSIYNAILNETDNTRRTQLYREAQRAITSEAASVYIQDIYYPKAFKAGAFDGVLNYPLYVIDFASIYRRT
ncbi:MAG: ABC transporter substrate-binding protein [Treponema sp.]|nr:ABC transporter substrate-binding protein [Treponema sp.]